MAFNFYGTFTTGQFDKFLYFSKLQEQDIKKRIETLQNELFKIGIFTTEYNENNQPLSFSVAPDYSYGAKLLLAYKILGGNPETDMLLRTRDKPVYLTRGGDLTNDPTDLYGGYSIEFTNGRFNRGTMRFDRDVGVKVDKVKKWQHEVIKRKRESLEYKIKKALDYSDQIEQEIKMLQKMVNEDTISYSLDYLVSEVSSVAFRPGAMNVVQNMLDIFGLKIGEPVDVMLEADYNNRESRGGRLPGGSTNQEISTGPFNPLGGTPSK